MLVLTRKTEQGIIIDGVTIVRILAVDGERVKLGIDAPKHIGVLREELVREVEGANREAADPRTRSALMERLRSIQDAGPRGKGSSSGPEKPDKGA